VGTAQGARSDFAASDARASMWCAAPSARAAASLSAATWPRAAPALFSARYDVTPVQNSGAASIERNASGTGNA